MDKYSSFDALQRAERDYGVIEIRRPNTSTLVIAPHGGAIEPRTSEIARAIAGDSFSFYAFEGKKKSDNRDLHITSTRFDEPQGLRLVQAHRWIVAIHGCKGDSVVVLLGGRDEGLIEDIRAELAARGLKSTSEGHDFPGREPANICNRGLSGMGVQIELTMPLRTGPQVQLIVGAVRASLGKLVVEQPGAAAAGQ